MEEEVRAAGTPREVRATVAALRQNAEAVVVGQQQWEAIHARSRAGQSVSAIARELSLDRKTVRSCLQRAQWQPYCRPATPSQLDAHRTWLAQRAPQVNFSARILWQELSQQRGFAGSYVVVRRAVAPLRLAAAASELTLRRFETAPGEQAQCDWGQVGVALGGERRVVHIFVMTLGYSRRGFALGFEHERMPHLLAAHEAAFEHFGGRCESLLYDRMRTVVLGTEADKPRFNPTFAAFAKHWGFTPRLCQPYRARTKGKVESGVKYVKRNFVPGRVFRDLDDFNAQLAQWQFEVADVRIHGTTHERPIERFAAEAAALVPTAGQPSFLQAMVRERVVADDWLIAVDGNRYSVPFGLIGRTVQVVREGGCWVIRYRGAVVAQHAVLGGRAQLSVLPAHGPGAVARNRRQRFAAAHPSRPPPVPDVEIRDLAIYEQLSTPMEVFA